MHYKKLIAVSILLSTATLAQGQLFKNILNPKATSQNDDAMIASLRADVLELANNKYAGRQLGTNGYNNITAHLEKRMSELGLVRYGTIGYKSVYKYVTGRSATVESRFQISGKNVVVNTDALPLPFCSDEENNAFVVPGTCSSYSAWVDHLFDQDGNQTFDSRSIKPLIKKILNAQDRGATALYLYDNSSNGIDMKEVKKLCDLPQHAKIHIPVWILSKKAYNEHLKNVDYIIPIYSNPKFRNDYKEGYNVAGTINHNAEQTVVIMADYDQLYDPETAAILNGANDNASGVAILLQLATLLKDPAYKQYNYAFITFSGSQVGALGAGSFLSIKGIKSKIAYAIDITAPGKLSEQAAIYLNGVGSAPQFAPAIKSVSEAYNPKVGSSYPHESSYTRFLDEGIPTLSFSAGYDPRFTAAADNITGINFNGMALMTRYITTVISALNQADQPHYSSTYLSISDRDLAPRPVVAAAPEKVSTTPAKKISTNTPKTARVPAKKPIVGPTSIIKKSRAKAPVSNTEFRGARSIVKDFLGLGINELDSREGGAYIYSIDQQGLGAGLGFTEGDVVLQIGSFPVFNAKSYLLTLRKFKSGERTYFKVKKADGKTAMINVNF